MPRQTNASNHLPAGAAAMAIHWVHSPGCGAGALCR